MKPFVKNMFSGLRSRWMTLAALALLVSACGDTSVDTRACAGGAGSASSSAAKASVTSSASGGIDAGPDVVDDAPPPEDAAPVCGSCSEALYNPDHLAGEQHLCPGSLAQGSWYAWINCACAPPPYVGNCYASCQGSAFCAGIYPSAGPWADPDAACKACLDTPGAGGCFDQATTCAKT